MLNTFITTLGGKTVLILAVITISVGAIVVAPKLIKDPVLSSAEKHFHRFREDIKYYKDIEFNLIDKQEKTAKARVEFATSRTCITPQKNKPDIFKNYYLPLSKGYIELSEEDINGLVAMGLVKGSQWHSPNEMYFSNDAPKGTGWKKCYEVLNFKKYGDSWEFDSSGKDAPSGAGAYYFFFPPKEQEKLGYKITDEMRKKVSSGVKGNWKTLEGETYTGQKFTVSYPAEYQSSSEKDKWNCLAEDGPCTYYLLTARDTQGNHFINLGPKYKPVEPPSGYPPKELQAVTVDGQNFTLEVIKAKDLKDYKDFIEAVVAPSNTTSSNFKGEPLFKLISTSADEKYLADFRQILETLQIK